MGSVPWVILCMASDFVADEAFVVLHMFCSFYEGEPDGIDVHDIRVLHCPGKKRPDAASSLEGSNSFLLSMELACLPNPFVQCGGDVLD